MHEPTYAFLSILFLIWLHRNETPLAGQLLVPTKGSPACLPVHNLIHHLHIPASQTRFSVIKKRILASHHQEGACLL